MRIVVEVEQEVFTPTVNANHLMTTQGGLKIRLGGVWQHAWPVHATNGGYAPADEPRSQTTRRRLNFG